MISEDGQYRMIGITTLYQLLKELESLQLKLVVKVIKWGGLIAMKTDDG